MYLLLFRLLQILLLSLLVAVPLIYGIRQGKMGKSFFFTWIVWAVVLFVFGMFVPALARLRELATGEAPDFDGFGFMLGIVMGWLPGLIFGALGTGIHVLIKKCKRNQDAIGSVESDI